MVITYDTETRNSMLIGADGSWKNVTEYRSEAMEYMSELTPFGVK